MRLWCGFPRKYLKYQVVSCSAFSTRMCFSTLSERKEEEGAGTEAPEVEDDTDAND